MSEHFLSDATVLIRPDTTKFRALLEEELLAATRGVTVAVPVTAVATVTGAATAGAAAATAAAKDVVAASAAGVVASTEHAAAMQTEGAAAAKTAAQEAALARIQQADAAIQADLAAATQAGVLATTKLAEARAVLSAATRVAKAAEANLAAATQVGNVETLALAESTAAAAAALRASAFAAAADEAALARNAGAAAAAAAAHEQLARGASASVLSMGGVRGATLAASRPFLIGAAAVTLLAKSYKEATQEQEAFFRVEQVLGPTLAEDSRKWSESLAGGFGLSETAALRAEGALADVFHVVHVAPEDAAVLSRQLVQLAADMAVFNNVPVDTTLRALQLGISGNMRSLRQFGVVLRQADVQQQALHDSGKANTDELTRQDLVLARVKLIMRDTANQTGSYAERATSASGETRTLVANLENFGATIGRVVIPVLTAFEADLNLLFLGLHKTGDGLGFLGDKLGNWAADLVESLPGGEHLMEKIGRATQDAVPPAAALTNQNRALAEAGHELITVYDTLTGKIIGTAHSYDEFVSLTRHLDFSAAIRQTDALSEHLLDLKFTGASDTEIIANLQKQIGAAQAAIRTSPTVSGRVQARERRNQAQAEIQAILDKEAAERKATADKAKAFADQILQMVEDAARFVQEQLDKADQAFLDAIGLRQARLQNQALIAESTKTLHDDIAANVAIRNFLQQAIVDARKTISDVLLRAQTIVQLRGQVIQASLTIQQLKAEEAKALRDARKQANETRQESLQLDIQFAQTTGTEGHRAPEIRAREALVRELRREQAATKRGTVEWKKLRNEIAAEQAAIKELRKQQADRQKEFQTLSFGFLQAQQGFASSLLSNILPTSALAGTVGGSTSLAITTPTSPERQRPPDVGAGLGAQAAISASPRAVSASQMGTLIAISRQMLVVLERLSGAKDHPEATSQRIAATTTMSHGV
jgi:hypothetical protein